MRNIKYALMLSALLVPVFTVQAQKSANKEKDSSENAVWYNARHGDASAMNQLGVWYYTGNKVPKDYSQAFEWWRQAALKQNPKAISNLGVCYQYGRGVEADSVQALNLYLLAIQTGQQELFEQRLANVRKSAFDDMLIGTCYERGIGTEADPSCAADIYALAANKGSVEGMRAAADAYLASGNANDAVRYYEKAAAAGDIHSLYMSGKMRLGGMGVAASKSRGLANIQEAADAGDADAMTALGLMYLRGDGVAADIHEASRWLKAGAQGGSAEGMWQYGLVLKNEGRLDDALLWLSLAVEAGYEDEFAQLMSDIPQKDAFAAYVRGMRHYKVNGSMDAAINEFSAINEKVSTDGRVMEAVVLADERYSKSKPSKAVKTLEKYADKNPLAAYHLAQLTLDGNGTERSSSRAISLLRKASNAGSGKASDALGRIYFDGIYTTRDLSGAREQLRKAYLERQLSAEGAEKAREIDPGMVGGYLAIDPIVSALSK